MKRPKCSACVAMVWLGFTLASTGGAAAPTTLPVTEVRVTHLVSDRFPILTEVEVSDVLRTASEMIAAGYRRDVRFVPARNATQTTAVFFAETHRLLDPYQPAERAFDPFTGKAEDLAPVFLAAVRATDDLPHLHTLLGRPTPFADEAAAARALQGTYRARLTRLQSFRGPDGKERIGRDTREQSSLSHWDVYVSFGGPKAQYDLILFNGVFIEDSPSLSSFHTLAAATANGTAYPVANNCAVAYFPVLSGEAAIRSDRLGELTRRERLAAIAYTVAHEVGTHLLMLRRDDYVPDAGLARPLFTLATKAEILAYRDWPPPAAKPRPIDELYFRCEIAKTRLDIAAARGNEVAFSARFLELSELPADLQWKQRVSEAAKKVFLRAQGR